jgi:RNA recognition motif-containing protein
MSTYVYVGNLDAGTTEARLGEVFAATGHPVKSAVIMRSPQNDRSRKFGFVELESDEQVAAVIEKMNGVELDGKPLKVGQVRERPRPRDGRSEGYGFGRSSGPRRSCGAKRKTR